MSRVLVVPLGLVLLGGLLGAKGKNKPAPAPAPAPVVAPVPEPIVPPQVGDLLASATVKAQVKLDDPGGMPRAVVKFAPRPDAVKTIEQTMTMSGDMSLSGPNGAMPMPFPASPPEVTRSRYSVLPPAENGFSRVHVELLAPPGGAAPGTAAALLQGMAYDVMLDGDGKPVQLDVSGGDPAIASMVQQLADQFASGVPTLPSEPVGPGAKWTVTMDFGIGGMNLQATQTSTLVAVSADAIDLDVALQMKPGEGGVTLPGLPPGTAEVKRFDGHGQGKAHIDLATMASSGTMSMDLVMELAMTMPGQGPMTMSMNMHQTMETREVE